MRVSLLSRFADFSAKGSAMPSRRTTHGLLFRQVRSGWLPDFCSDGGGGRYRPTSTLLTLRVRAGVTELSEIVLVSDQTSSWVDGMAVDRPLPVPCASAAEVLLRKCSVPLLLESPTP